MHDSFLIAVNAVIPFLCYLALGYLARCTGAVDEVFLNRLTRLAGQLVFTSTVLAIVTLFIWVLGMSVNGLL